jgi:hypothetical protein
MNRNRFARYGYFALVVASVLWAGASALWTGSVFAVVATLGRGVGFALAAVAVASYPPSRRHLFAIGLLLAAAADMVAFAFSAATLTPSGLVGESLEAVGGLGMAVLAWRWARARDLVALDRIRWAAALLLAPAALYSVIAFATPWIAGNLVAVVGSLLLVLQPAAAGRDIDRGASVPASA